MNDKIIQKHILEKNTKALLELNAENIASWAINEKFCSRWLRNPDYNHKDVITVKYDSLGRMYPSDCLQDTSYDEFVDNLIIELAKVNRISHEDFDRVLQCRDINLARTVWDIMKFPCLQYWYDRLPFGCNPIYSLEIMKWWVFVGGKFNEESLKLIAGMWRSGDFIERILFLLEYQPELFDVKVLSNVAFSFSKDEFVSLMKCFKQPNMEYFTKQDAQFFVDNSFITKLEIVKYLEQVYQIKADPKHTIINTAHESYDEYLKACQHYHIDSETYINDVFDSFEDDDTFETFFNQVKREKGEDYLKLHLEYMKDKVFEGNFSGNLALLNQLYKDSDLAKISAWTSYDMFCAWQGRSSYEKYREEVMRIINFYKTWVPEYNNVEFKSEDELDMWVNKNWS